MSEERNKYLTIKLGGCNREEGYKRSSGYLCCVACNQIIDRQCEGTIDFSLPVNFFRLLTWCKKQNWFNNDDFGYSHPFNIYNLDPVKFVDSVYEYLKDREYGSDGYWRRSGMSP